MGDLHRHAQVFEHARQALVKIRPDEDYICLELGNYLADVSQFRDPFAHMVAKRTVWNEGRGKGALWWIGLIPVLGTIAVDAILDWAIDLDEWINDLLGSHEPATKRHGNLAAYMTAIIEGVTHLIFADDIPKADFWRSMLLPQVTDLKPLSAAEVERIFGQAYTQYYPHEHTDFPPYVLYGEYRPRHRVYRRGPRGLSNYLEEYIDYLAESLAKIEVDWKAVAGIGKSDPKRHDILLRLGKVLHGIEDYFFHSNYLEIHLWNYLRRGRRTTETDDEYRVWFAQNIKAKWLPRDHGSETSDVAQDAWRPSATHQVRAHLRRLRYPEFIPVNRLDSEKSSSSLDHLYTAGFDKKDLFHTLAMALESMASSINRLENVLVTMPPDLAKKVESKSPTQLSDSKLVLIKTVFNKSFRARMGRDEDYLDEQMTLHQKQLDSGLYEDGISHLRSRGYLNAQAEAAWKRAIAVDKEMERFGKRTPGVGGFMIGFLARAQAELEKSRKLSRRFDTANDYGATSSTPAPTMGPQESTSARIPSCRRTRRPASLSTRKPAALRASPRCRSPPCWRRR